MSEPREKTEFPPQCPECGAAWSVIHERNISMTCVGFFSPPGHRHDNNCVQTYVDCENKHRTVVSLRRTCKDPSCDWRGRDECFCHPFKKVDSWPLPVSVRPWWDDE